MCCLVYWSVLLAVYIGVFIASDDVKDSSASTMLKIFQYRFPAKASWQ